MSLSLMVTGVGAIIGQGIIKSLKNSGLSLRMIGIDANPSAVGFQWVDVKYIVPMADDSSWCDAVINICKKEDVVLVLPGIEQDVKALLRNRDRLYVDAKAALLLNSSEAFEVGFDKWKLFCFAEKNKVKIPPTWLFKEVNTGGLTDDIYPLLLKPREGMAGKSIYRIENTDDLRYWSSRVKTNEYILQRYVGDDHEEYTVGIFGFKSGELSEPFILKRRLNYGSTFEAETVKDEALAEEVTRIAKKLHIIGPTNLQFRKVRGDYLILEINPRFSSSTSIKSLFGFNEPIMAVKSFLLGEPSVRLKLKRGRCFRYIEDYVIYE